MLKDGLEQSPCYPIIRFDNIRLAYCCKLHPKESENVNLESAEHHCKYKDPELHEKEIIKEQYFEENKIGETVDKLLLAI